MGRSWDVIREGIPDIVFDAEKRTYTVDGEVFNDSLAAAKHLVWWTRKGEKFTIQEACRLVLNIKAEALGTKPDYMLEGE